jgi:hypothetical protein
VPGYCGSTISLVVVVVVDDDDVLRTPPSGETNAEATDDEVLLLLCSAIAEEKIIEDKIDDEAKVANEITNGDDHLMDPGDDLITRKIMEMLLTDDEVCR